jgi:hypothetical protein
VGTKNLALLIIAALMAEPLAANAASVTYDFTGTVTNAVGSYSSIADGTAVTGTLTLTLSNAVPSQSAGAVGSTTSNWVLAAYSGSDYGTAINPAVVVSTTINVGSTAYNSTTSGSYVEETYVAGNVSNSPNGYSAVEINEANSKSQTSSDLSLYGTTPPWSASALPLFSAASSATDYFIVNNNGTEGVVYFNVTSLVPVPVPAAAWLMLSGLGGFAAFVRKKRAS